MTPHKGTPSVDLPAVQTAIEAARVSGCPVAGNPELQARIALRRWRSHARRDMDALDRQARIADLAKGLAQAFERDRRLLGPLMRDYEYLASKIADTLDTC